MKYPAQFNRLMETLWFLKKLKKLYRIISEQKPAQNKVVAVKTAPNNQA